MTLCFAFVGPLPIIVIVYVPIKYFQLNLIFLPETAPETAPEMFYFLISAETTINAACYFGRKNIAAQLSSGIYIKRFSSRSTLTLVN